MRSSPRSGWSRGIIFLAPTLLGILTFVYPSTDFFEPLNVRHTDSAGQARPSVMTFSSSSIPLQFDYPSNWTVAVETDLQPTPGSPSLTMGILSDEQSDKWLHQGKAADGTALEKLQGHGFEGILLKHGKNGADLLIPLNEKALLLRFRTLDSRDTELFKNAMRRAQMKS